MTPSEIFKAAHAQARKWGKEFGAYSVRLSIALKDLYSKVSKKVNKITVESLRALGVDKVARFAGCINANYLVHINPTMAGLSYDGLEKVKNRYTEYVKKNYEAYINAVAESFNTEPVTMTDKYKRKAYLEWYA
jgi:hypothetical protein